MKTLLTILESAILLALVALLARGLMNGELTMIVPASVLLLTLGALIVSNYFRSSAAKTSQHQPEQ